MGPTIRSAGAVLATGVAVAASRMIAVSSAGPARRARTGVPPPTGSALRAVAAAGVAVAACRVSAVFVAAPPRRAAAFVFTSAWAAQGAVLPTGLTIAACPPPAQSPAVAGVALAGLFLPVAALAKLAAPPLLVGTGTRTQRLAVEADFRPVPFVTAALRRRIALAVPVARVPDAHPRRAAEDIDLRREQDERQHDTHPGQKQRAPGGGAADPAPACLALIQRTA